MNILPPCSPADLDTLADALFERLLFHYQNTLNEEYELPHKQRLFYDPSDPNQHERLTIMSCMDDDGKEALTKIIFASDYLRKTEAHVLLTSRQGEFTLIPFGQLNLLRTALSAVVAMKIAGGVNQSSVLALIGTGRINSLVARYAFRFLGVCRIAALNRGGSRSLLDAEAVSLDLSVAWGKDALKHADAVVTCTTNDDPRRMLTERDLPSVTLAVALDGGNVLAGEFRDWPAFADAPSHWPSVARDEFWDGGRTPRVWKPLSDPRLRLSSARVVWLYGNALADLLTAQSYCHHFIKEAVS